MRFLSSAIQAIAVAALISGCGATSAPSLLVSVGPTTPMSSARNDGPLESSSVRPSATAAASPSRSRDVEAIPTPVDGAWDVHPVTEYGYATAMTAALTSGAVTLHSLYYQEENLDEAWDADVYSRSRDGGRTWTDEQMIRGISSQIAAAGAMVYLAYEAYGCGGGIGVLRNTKDGARGSWSRLACLTRDTELGTEWAASVAATKTAAYVTALEPESGRVQVWISRDRGRSWHRQIVGTARASDCCFDQVFVAATGDIVAVAWTEGDGTTSRMSVDAGRHWQQKVTLGAGAPTSASARDGRVAISGFGTTEDLGVGSAWVAVYRDADWRQIVLPELGDAIAADLAAPTVTVGPKSTLGSLYCALPPDEELEEDVGPPQAVWVASADDGTTWADAERLPGGSCPDRPQAAWPDPHLAAVLVNGDDENVAVAIRK